MELTLWQITAGQARGSRGRSSIRCSSVPRANTASLSGHGSAKLSEQELHLRIAQRRTEQRCGPRAERHEGQVRPCRHDVLVVDRVGLSCVALLSGFGEQTQVAVSSWVRVAEQRVGG